MLKDKKKKLIVVLICIFTAAVILACTLFVFPAIHENECKTRVFEDMKSKIDTVTSSVIGIIPKETGADGSVTYGSGGSGVVFRHEGDVYYALTAAHVVNKSNSDYKVYTVRTKQNMIQDSALENAGIEILDNSFYESLADVKTEHISIHSDIAVISFRSKDELNVIEFSENQLKPNDRIVCIGHPYDKNLTFTYGNITSDIKSVMLTDKITGKTLSNNVIEHNAYIYFGNSGGAAVSEDMKLAGINIGGSLDIFGHFNSGFLISCEQLDNCISEWEAKK